MTPIFRSSHEAHEFHQLLNIIHPSLKFTREDEEGNKLAFLDIDISHWGPHLLRSIYRKKMFTGLYIRYDSFCPRHHKLAIIKSLASGTKRICAPSLLQEELDNLRTIFTANGFPINIINKCIEQAMEVRSIATEEDNTRMVFRLPYIGQKSSEFGHRIKKTSSGSISNGRDYHIFHNNVRVSEYRKKKAIRRQRKVQ